MLDSLSKRVNRLKKVLIAPCLFILSGGGLIFHQRIPAVPIFPHLQWKVYSAFCDFENNLNPQINNRSVIRNPSVLQVELKIDLQKKCFYQGEKINLRASIENKTNSRLIIAKDHNYVDKIIPLNNIVLSLKNSSGESVPELDLIRGTDRPRGRPIDETIEPSETYTHNFFINYLYNLTVPGVYVFRIEQDVRVETGDIIHLTSNQIHFRVIEDPSLLFYGKKKEMNVIPTSNNKSENESPFVPAFRFHLQSNKNLYSMEESINIQMSLMNPEKKVIHVPGLQTLFPALDFEIYRSNGARISSTPLYQYQVSHIPPASNEDPLWLPPDGNFSFPLQINTLFNFDKSDIYTMKVRLKPALPGKDDIISNQIQFTIQGRKW